ncbi:hypothetical protein [Nocardioides mangrovi]|uniref:Uncharacterized protein n=1 Tax=Nocardioides mangrovi TaxID=2874580 RepID=A0ABS7U9D0_9ACTN|nr:hypothetical protein [Nocardioides mangrovi]MBZ5737584.1 hypothetical protein [Nocardioides mangrovi]
MFWLVAGAVALVLFALAWWTSGRARKGVDGNSLRRNRGAIDGNINGVHDPGRSGPGGIGLGGGGGGAGF